MFKLSKYFIFRLAVKMAKLDLIKIQRLFGESGSLGSGLFKSPSQLKF